VNHWYELVLSVFVFGLILLLAKLFGAPIPWGVVMAPFIPIAFAVCLLLMGVIVLLAQEWKQRSQK
jgi:hypothetical protein